LFPSIECFFCRPIVCAFREAPAIVFRHGESPIGEADPPLLGWNMGLCRVHAAEMFCVLWPSLSPENLRGWAHRLKVYLPPASKELASFVREFPNLMV
jgi:hypothetical protein